MDKKFWQTKAAYLQQENEQLRAELLDARILAGEIRLEASEAPVDGEVAE